METFYPIQDDTTFRVSGFDPESAYRQPIEIELSGEQSFFRINLSLSDARSLIDSLCEAVAYSDPALQPDADPALQAEAVHPLIKTPEDLLVDRIVAIVRERLDDDS